jgi:hypothetical protein
MLKVQLKMIYHRKWWREHDKGQTKELVIVRTKNTYCTVHKKVHTYTVHYDNFNLKLSYGWRSANPKQLGPPNRLGFEHFL